MKRLILIILFIPHLIFAQEIISDLITIDKEGKTTQNEETLSVLNEELRTKVDTKSEQIISGDKTFSSQITSTIPAGTAPLSVVSTTKVSNLNVDTLDGYDTSTTSGASKIYVSDASGFIPNQLGSWVDVSGAYANVLAATDGFIVAVGQVSAGVVDTINFFTDSSNPPTTQRAAQIVNTYGGGVSLSASLTCPVKKGDRWTLTKGAGVTIISVYWIPSGN